MAANRNSGVVATTFSFVVPFRDQAQWLPTFYRELHQAAEKLEEPYEIVFVDDGSTDESAEILRQLRSEDDHVRYVELSRSFGPRAALTAGLDCAAGMAVVALDSRCRCTSDLLGQLIEKWRQGYEVVYTVPTEAPPLPWAKRWAGGLARWVFRKLPKPDPAAQAAPRLLDRKVVDALRAARERAPSLRSLLDWMGFRQVTVPHEAEGPPQPQAGCPLTRMAKAVAGAVFSYSALPLRFVGAAGLVMLAAAVVYGIVALICWPLLGVWATANLIFLAVGLLGVQLAVLGVLGESIGKIYDEARDRPVYVVRQAVGFDVDEEEARPRTHPGAREVVASESSRIRFFT